MNRIEAAFANTGRDNRAALMPYYTLGYPNRELSLAIVEAIAPYCDLLELGVPFSDPLADGPTIQHSTQLSLAAGTTVGHCLDMVAELRRRGMNKPILLMGYYNPILAYGPARYVQEAGLAGADGFIVPDLPPEEAEELEKLASEAGLVVIHFLAPTSNPRRIGLVTGRAKGFIYLVSVTGVTGARQELDKGLELFTGRIRSQTNIPLAIGFGISTPEQAARVGQFADGVIVGSALINAINAAEDKVSAAIQFIQSLQAVLRPRQ